MRVEFRFPGARPATYFSAASQVPKKANFLRTYGDKPGLNDHAVMNCLRVRRLDLPEAIPVFA